MLGMIHNRDRNETMWTDLEHDQVGCISAALVLSILEALCADGHEKIPNHSPFNFERRFVVFTSPGSQNAAVDGRQE